MRIPCGVFVQLLLVVVGVCGALEHASRSLVEVFGGKVRAVPEWMSAGSDWKGVVGRRGGVRGVGEWRVGDLVSLEAALGAVYDVLGPEEGRRVDVELGGEVGSVGGAIEALLVVEKEAISNSGGVSSPSLYLALGMRCMRELEVRCANEALVQCESAARERMQFRRESVSDLKSALRSPHLLPRALRVVRTRGGLLWRVGEVGGAESGGGGGVDWLGVVREVEEVAREVEVEESVEAMRCGYLRGRLYMMTQSRDALFGGDGGVALERAAKVLLAVQQGTLGGISLTGDARAASATIRMAATRYLLPGPPHKDLQVLDARLDLETQRSPLASKVTKAILHQGLALKEAVQSSIASPPNNLPPQHPFQAFLPSTSSSSPSSPSSTSSSSPSSSSPPYPCKLWHSSASVHLSSICSHPNTTSLLHYPSTSSSSLPSWELGILEVGEVAVALMGHCVAGIGGGAPERAVSACVGAYSASVSDSHFSPAALSNFAAALHRSPSIKTEEAAAWYRFAIGVVGGGVRLRNNFGAFCLDNDLLDEAITQFEKVLEEDSTAEMAWRNLGAALARRNRRGDAAQALSAYRKAFALTQKPSYLVQAAFHSPPAIMTSWESILATRKSMRSTLIEAIAAQEAQRKGDGAGGGGLVESAVEETPPFYILYHGVHDRDLLELSATVTLPRPLLLAPHLSSSSPSPPPLPNSPPPPLHSLWWQRGMDLEVATGARKVRVGFVSRYFTLNHAHGLLLRGVAAGLRREAFEVLCLRLDNAHMYRDPEFAAAADVEVRVDAASTAQVARNIASLKLDALIFADQHAEPTAYALSAHRLARVQVAFWGTPATSGRNAMDYFFSGDRMELPQHNAGQEEDGRREGQGGVEENGGVGGEGGVDVVDVEENGEVGREVAGVDVIHNPPNSSPPSPLRSRLRSPYSEQLVRVGGQGIWYDAVDVPSASRQGLRGVFGIPVGVPVLACPQSTFKLHPAFDAVIAASLRSLPSAVFVAIEGREQSWTRQLRERWETSFPDVASRVIWVPRQPTSLAFMELLSCVDVLLHPWPFGGSKTAADALAIGVPIVAMPTSYLRARMARSLLLSASLPQLLASSPVHYLRLVVALANDAQLRSKVGKAMRERGRAIWRRAEVQLQWESFLLTATHAPKTTRKIVRQELYAANKADQRSLDALVASSPLPPTIAPTSPHLPTPEEEKRWGKETSEQLVQAASLAAGEPVVWPWEDGSDERAGRDGRSGSGADDEGDGGVEIHRHGGKLWGAGEVEEGVEEVELGGVTVGVASAVANTVREAQELLARGDGMGVLRRIGAPHAWDGSDSTSANETFVANVLRGIAMGLLGPEQQEASYGWLLTAYGGLLLQRAVEEKPEAWQVWTSLTTMHTAANNASKAVEAAEKAKLLRPNDPSVLFNWMRAKERVNQSVQALTGAIATLHLPSRTTDLSLLTCLSASSLVADRSLQPFAADLVSLWLNQSILSPAAACESIRFVNKHQGTAAWAIIHRSIKSGTPHVIQCQEELGEEGMFNEVSKKVFRTAEEVAFALGFWASRLEQNANLPLASLRTLLLRLGTNQTDNTSNLPTTLSPKDNIDQHPLAFCPSLLRTLHLRAKRWEGVMGKERDVVDLVLQPFSTTDDVRMDEQAVALLVNVLNPLVGRVFLLVEEGRVARGMVSIANRYAEQVGVESKSVMQEKVVMVEIGTRLTVEIAMSFANVAVTRGRRVVLLNSDIALPPPSISDQLLIQESSSILSSSTHSSPPFLRIPSTLPTTPSSFTPSLWWSDVPPNTVWASTRWEWSATGSGGGGDGVEADAPHFSKLNHFLRFLNTPSSPPTARILPRIESQDAWAFQTPLHHKLIRPWTSWWKCSKAQVCTQLPSSPPPTPLSTTELGRPRVDGVVAHLLSTHNITVQNPALFLPSLHLHTSPKPHNAAPPVIGKANHVPFD